MAIQPRWQVSNDKTFKKYDIGDPSKVSRAELEAAVRGMGKAANQRLRTLGNTPATKGAKRALSTFGRERFMERTKSRSTAELVAEYKLLRNFLTAKTSSKKGATAAEIARYNTAKEAGYHGTLEDFRRDVETAFAKNAKGIYDSDVVYEMLTAGQVRKLEHLYKSESARAKTSAGQLLLEAAKAKNFEGQQLTIGTKS